MTQSLKLEFGMQWICDTCGGRINSVKDGWVEWQSCQNEEGHWVKHSPRLVHHLPASPLKGGCQYDGDFIFENGRNIVGDMPLDNYVGTDGLINLLEFLSDQSFELEQTLELIKRIQIPNYDLARSYFDEAIGEGVFEPNAKPGYYGQDQINRVKEWIDAGKP
ncbi:hypothetical protein ACF8O8_13350 [Pseudomonas sp. TYF_14]|jgi:hypothetical protein|uniref:hypothetical protein n=1 Tax=Pseudomonas sp. TYF_14 TaxID=3367193 RepID=UPI00370C243C